MTRSPAKITVRIDRILSDQPTLENAALQAALQAEISRIVTTGGPTAFGASSDHSQKEVPLPDGNDALATRIAAATVKAVSS